MIGYRNNFQVADMILDMESEQMSVCSEKNCSFFVDDIDISPNTCHFCVERFCTDHLFRVKAGWVCEDCLTEFRDEILEYEEEE